ncbi:hypothetical protein ACVWV0_003466 [Ewingella americana]
MRFLFNCIFNSQGRGRRPTPTRLCVATQAGIKVKVVRCRHTGLKGRLSPRPLRIPGSLLRAIARWADVFQGLSLYTAKCRRLGGAFAAGFKPLVLNLLLSAIFERGFEASKPNRFSRLCCFAPPPDKGEAGRGYYIKLSGLCEKYPTPTLP